MAGGLGGRIKFSDGGVFKRLANKVFKDRQLHLSNGFSQPIYVMVTPSMNFAFVNVITSALKMGVSSRDGSPSSPMSSMKNLSDIQKLTQLLSLMRLTQRSSTSNGVQIQPNPDELRRFLKENATALACGETKQLVKVNTVNPVKYLSAETWTALFNATSLSIFIATEDLTKFVFVESGADDSWIFRGESVVRAKYGSLWQDDPGAGLVYVSKGDRLPSGAYLEPGESLTSANRKYVFIYQHDGNAVVYDVQKVEKHVPVWASNTGGRAAWRLELRDKGEVVLWSEKDKRVWTDPRSGTDKATSFSKCFLAIGDDGVLRVVGDQKKVGWSSQWKSGESTGETWG